MKNIQIAYLIRPFNRNTTQFSYSIRPFDGLGGKSCAIVDSTVQSLEMSQGVRVQGAGLRVKGLEFRVQGLGFKVRV